MTGYPASPRRRAAATLASAALLAALAGCAQTVDGRPAALATLSIAQIRQALLSQREIGTGFVARNDPETTGGGYCAGTRDPDRAVPPGARYGRDFTNGTDGGFSEEIESYPSATRSHDALRAIVAAFGCGRVDASGTTLVFTGPADVSGQLGVDEAASWQVRGTNLAGTAVVARDGSDLVEFEFINVQPAVAVVRAGIAKDTAAH